MWSSASAPADAPRTSGTPTCCSPATRRRSRGSRSPPGSCNTDRAVVAEASSTACLTEDALLGLAAGTLADAPAAEAHLAVCPPCSTLLAGAVRAEDARGWSSLVGGTLGPYRIDAQIGAGGMGAVYRAWDPRLGRAIAVKVLHGDGAARSERLLAEAR